MQTGYKELKRKSSYDNKYEGRNIPFGMKFKVIFGHFMMIFGISFGGIGLLFLIIFGSMTDFDSIKFNKNSPTVIGEIINIEPTNSYVNNIQVIKYYYKFNVNSKEYSGESYSTGGMFVDKVVTIEYVENKPEISRIQGTRNGAFEIWVLLIILPFVIIGFTFIIIRIKNGLKAVKLLEYGEIAFGKLIEKTPTGTQINNQTVYKLTFEFQANDGMVYRAIGKTHKTYNLEDEEFEKLVYDVNNPQKAVMIDELPRNVKMFFQDFKWYLFFAKILFKNGNYLG